MPDEPLDRPAAFETGRVDSDLLFRQAMSQTRMAMCLTDPRLEDNPLVFVNEAFRRLTGYSDEELLGSNCRLLQGAGTDPETVATMREAIEEENVVVVELLNYRRDGTEFWNALHLGPIYDADGTLQFYYGSQWDVSDVHTARARQHLAEMFSRELAHRMKNMFAVISGIVSMSARHEGVPRVARVVNERIAALGRAYDDSLTSSALEDVELGRIARLTLEPWLAERPDRVLIRGERVMMPPTTVSLIGLVLHELASNAVRHGALADESGRVELDWAFDSDRALVVQWRERFGDGAASPPPWAPASGKRAGAGRGIVDDLMHAAGGHLDTRWSDDGIRVRMSLPIEIVLASRGRDGR